MRQISVILSTHNRADLLDQTLRSFAGLNVDGLTWEVIVVDNGSTDRTSEVIESWKSALPLVGLFEPLPGKNRALNQAVKVSRGELLVFTDDDVVPCASWLKEFHSASLRWPNDSLFGGMIVPRFPPETPDFLRRREFPPAEECFCWFDPPLPEGPMPNYPFGANMAIRRAVCEAVEYCETVGPAGSNYAMGSERELLERLERRGYRYIYAPGATIEHVIRPEQVSFAWLNGRAYRSGRGEARRNPPEYRRLFLGAPPWLIRLWINELVRVAFAALRGTEAMLLTSMQARRYLGMISECRLMFRDRERQLAVETGSSKPT